MRLGDLDYLARWLKAVVASLPIEDKARAGFLECLAKVNTMEEVKAVPVRHGRWERAHGMMPPEYHHRKKCSLCGEWALQESLGRELMSRYCPACGAKMDGKENARCE